MNAPIQIGVAVARNPKARKLLLTFAVAVLAALFALVVVMVSSVGALAAMCQKQAESSSAPTDSPSGYVSNEPSQQAVADIPANYLTAYEAAAKEYNLDWAILAAIGKHETDHGEGGKEETCISSSAGAQGPMQFMPDTWASEGVDGNGDGKKDVCNYEDAIYGAANYLSDSGAPQDYHSAILAYNHDEAYIQWVLDQAAKYRSAEKRTPPAPSDTGTDSGGTDSGSSDPGSFSQPTGGTGSPPQGWDLVDSNRQIDYELNTQYASYFEEAAKNWNALGGVNIEPSPSPSETDLAVNDGDLDGLMGWTESNGTMIDDVPLMSESTDNARVALFEHELGHALGFPHTEEDSTMNPPVITNSDANHAGPSSYDTSVYRKTWGGPPKGGGGSTDQGGAGTQIQGNQNTVFPLPAQYMDAYDDTWGASRGSGRTHEGTDIFAPDGTPIYSITNGTVVPVSGADSNGWNELGGYTIMIEADYSIGPIVKGDMLYYAHMPEPQQIPIGKHVTAGQIIGHVGSTGEGPPGTILPDDRGHHLHQGWYDPSGSRAEAPSGAMNPYPMLNWLKDNGGTATGHSPTLTTSPNAQSLPAYCLPLQAAGFISGVATKVGGFIGGSDEQSPDGTSAPPSDVSAEDLLNDPNFSAAPEPTSDLQNGKVKPQTISMLKYIAQKHKIYVSALINDGYGQYLPASMGGVPNSHWYGLAADVAQIDGLDVASHQTDPAVLDVGNMLLAIPQTERPDEIVGPTPWTQELGVTRDEGFITDPAYTEAHYDHLHIGWSP